MKEARSDKKVLKRNRALRLVVLLVVLGFTATIGVLHQHVSGTVPVGVDALCPFGAIESVWQLISSGSLLQRIAVSTFILFGATTVVALIFRRSFCGYICPLGTLQELAARLGRRLFRKRLTVPRAIDRPLRYLKYLVLVAVAVLSAVLATLVIRPVDPWAAFQHLSAADIFTEFLGGFIVLVASLVLSLFFDRIFCKYVCPMGAFLGVVSKVGLFKVRRNRETCIDCMACDKACPVNIPVQSLDKVSTAECLSCGECVNACPVQNTLFFEGPKKKRLAPPLMIGLTLAIFGLVVGSTTLTGSFKWTVQSVEERARQTGAFNPDDITGRSTFREVADLSGVPKTAFIERFGISNDDFEAPIRDAAHREGSGFDTEDVRAFVKERLAGK